MLETTLMRKRFRMLRGLILVWMSLSLPVMVAAVPDESEPLIEMSTSVAERIEEGIRNYPSNGRDPENLRQTNARKNAMLSFDQLRRLRWPDYSKLTLVKIEDLEAICPSQQIMVAWIGSANSETITLLTSENELVPLPAKRYRIETFPFERFWESERRYVLKEYDPDSEPIDWVTVNSKGAITSRGQSHDVERIVNFVYLASSFEKTKELTVLLDRELDNGPWGNEGPLAYAWHHLHTHRLRQGQNLLTTGGPLPEIVSHWSETERLFGGSALRPLIQRLEKQIDEDHDVKDLDAEAIAQLAPNEQVRYWVAHLPQDRGRRSYSIMNYSDPVQAAANALQKLGWHAVPQLITALRDTRLTRTLYSESWEEEPLILRVCDVARAILREFIEEASLFKSDGAMFSERTPQEQSESIARIEAWWKEHGQNSERAWCLSRLEQRGYQTRMRALTRLEQLDPTAVNSEAMLLAWVESAEERELVPYSDQLRQRGFAGPIPRLDQLMSLHRQEGYQKLTSSVLLCGELQDFRFLQQCLRMKTPTQFTADSRTRIWSDLTLDMLRQFYVAPQEVPQLSPLAIIMFVDLLDRDRLVGLPGRQHHNSILEFDQSQNALVILQRLTGHEVEWDRTASLSERKATMDQWLAWWHESGRADYLREHPEVAPLFEDAWQKGATVAIDKLPELVDAEDPREFCRITYRVPRDSVAPLVADDSLLGNTVPQFADRFRFATPAAAEKWFRSESPVSGQPLPCMIVPIADSMDADTKGRIWCRWDLFGFPPAVFENGEWTTFPEQRLPNSWPLGMSRGDTRQTTSWESIEPPRAGNEGSMFFPSAFVTGCGSKTEFHFDLVDTQGWLRFSVADLPQHASFDRILRAAPVGTSKYIARDLAGRILVNYGDWSVIENGKEIPRSAQLRDRRDNYYSPHAVIGNGDVWLFLRHDFQPFPFGIDQFVALAVEQGEIVEKPLPLAPQVGPPSVWVNQGPVETIDPTRNRDRFVLVFDSNGNVVARHDGHLVGVDSHGGRWLALGPRGAVESIQRINAAGEKQTWKDPEFRGPERWSETLFDLAFAPDGTVWLPIGQELVHMRGSDDAIEVIERFPLPEPGWQRIHCDPSGDVWIVFQNHQESDRRPRLYRFATHSKEADERPR